MKLFDLQSLEFNDLDWESYDLILLASGFESRSIYLLEHVPVSVREKSRVLGFFGERDKLSRPENDASYRNHGLEPLIFDSETGYEHALRGFLSEASRFAGLSRPMRILVDYSVMTRAWYGYILTWLKYCGEQGAAEVDFVYAHGRYHDDFEPLRITEVAAISGFEGGCAGSRSTTAAFGLGYDRYATLALYEQIEPDSLVCYVAQETEADEKTERAINENLELIRLAGANLVRIPLGNLKEIYRILFESFSAIDSASEIVAVPMGPKPHVLGTLLVAQAMPRVTCLHAKGYRRKPVQVTATGAVSCWRLCYSGEV